MLKFIRKRWMLKWAIVVFTFCTPNVESQSQRTTFIPLADKTLTNSFGRCFLKDSKGYMWIGTADGLMRYDGFRVYSYEHNSEDKNSIVNNGINVIVEDANQQLWIGTAQGLSIYNREKDNFTNVDSIASNKNHLNNSYITALSFDKQGNVWIGTYGGGVNIYNIKTSTFSYVSDVNFNSSPLAKNYITGFLNDDDLMWCASKGGIEIFNAQSKSLVSLKFTNGDLPTKQVSQLIKDDNQNIWFSTFDGEIHKLKKEGDYYSFENKISRENTELGIGWNDILTMAKDEKDNFWIGGENSGLNYFDTKRNKAISFSESKEKSGGFPTSLVRSIYKDDDGLIWIGTFNKGIYLIDNNAGKFDSYFLGDFKQSELDGKDVRAFAEDKSGNVWITFDGIGLVLLDKKTNSLKRQDHINKKIMPHVLTALTFDDYNNLWVGTGANGVYRINVSTNKVESYTIKSGGFGDNKVSYLYKDKQGVIWCGSNGSGLFYFDDKNQQFINFYEENKPVHISNRSYVSSILEDSENALWIGTMYGLYKLIRNKSGFDYKLYWKDSDSVKFVSNSVQCIYEDAHQNLWFGTTDDGVIFKPKHTEAFKTIQKKDGLSSNTVRSIVMDSLGNMWFGGNRGLSKLEMPTNLITNYDSSDGLSSNNLYNNSITSSSGKLFFASNNGFNSFYPHNIKTQSEKPIVYLTDLRINNKSVEIDAPNSPLDKHISLASNITFKYDERSFALEFVGVKYGQSPNYNYCYMLEGFDNDWNCIGSRHSATYTNIDPGNYVFLVKASNREGVWSDTKRLEITIKQVWWKTWWAIGIYIILISGILFFLFRIRLERFRMKNQLGMERLAREKEHALSESKSQFFTNISHEFRTPLSLIAMPLESLSAMEDLPISIRERIGAIQASSNKMLRLVNELMDFNKLENTKLKLKIQQGELIMFISNIANSFQDISRKRNIHFGIHSMVGTLNGWFDHDKLDKILGNLLSNAFKFTRDEGQINIIINCKEALVGDQKLKSRCLELSIVDNGIGISEDELPFIFDKFYQSKSSLAIANPGTGIGLSLTKGLVELHHGHIKVESKPNHETLFVILIPIDKEIYADESIGEVPECIDSIPEPQSHLEDEDDFENEESNDKPRILVVEDNEELRKYLVVELKHKFQVLEASNGQEGLQIAWDTSPDLIISDILMPIKNGIEFCYDIKTNLKTSHIPFILLTARTTVDDQIIGLETGADVYVTKPFSIRFLIVQVNQIIESRQKLYSQFSKDVYLLPHKLAQNEIDQEFLQKAIDYIVENIQNPQLGVNSIAELFNLSRMQVYRKIKALTGKSVVNFIRMVRIKQALKLMDTQKYSLAEIAYLTGFNSASYFTTSFKEEYGKAPSEYLEQNI